jgi:hypothetical protein
MRAAFVALMLAAACHGQTAEPKDILPDESLKGWTRIPIPPVDGLKSKLQWRVDAAEHTLVCAGDGGHEWLRYDQELGDFVLQVDFRYTPRGPEERRYNSGIGVRLSKYGELWIQAQAGLTGYLFGANFTEGAIKSFNMSKDGKTAQLKPAGEWNHYEVRVQADRITLSINGQLVNELTGVGLRRGYIALEAEGYEIAFKNLKLQPL